MAWKAVFPETVRKPVMVRTDDVLKITLEGEDSLGWWVAEFPVTAGTGCRISADASADTASGNDLMIIAGWKKPDGTSYQRDYVEFADRDGVRHFVQDFAVPADCVAVELRCLWKWRKGTAEFRNVKTEPCALPPARRIRVAVANIKPEPHAAYEKNFAVMEQNLKTICSCINDLDMIVYPECHNDRGVPLPLAKRAEPMDGPTFKLTSEYAAKYHTYIMNDIHELTPDGRVYNTAFIVDRQGKLCAKYRKVHLATAEFEGGCLPGDGFPVFQLDFGKVGIMICWDNWFQETSRQLRLGGAELLLYAIAGDAKISHWSKTWSAHCIDNGISMAVSICDPNVPSAIIDRDGEWLASTTVRNGFAFAELDLAERKRSFWLSVGPSFGDPTSLYINERHPETYTR